MDVRKYESLINHWLIGLNTSDRRIYGMTVLTELALTTLNFDCAGQTRRRGILFQFLTFKTLRRGTFFTLVCLYGLF